jgi:hypothetical protein
MKQITSSNESFNEYSYTLVTNAHPSAFGGTTTTKENNFVIKATNDEGE